MIPSTKLPAVPIPGRYLQELPPRKLNWYTQAVILCGDFVSQTGWALLAIGSIVFWTTVVRSEARIFFEEHTVDWQEKAGVVLEADSTLAVEKKKRVWKYRHSFSLDGQRYLGESYSIGKKFDAGQIVYIRYDAENPEKNYIIGNRRSMFSLQSNLLLLIPLFGVFFILSPIRQNLRFLRVLKIGDFTRGALVSKTATNQSVAKGGSVRTVFKYLFQFEQEGTLYLATCRTHQANLVEDEETEIILFDKYNPSLNIVYDAVPNVPQINQDGKMLPAPLEKAPLLFLPTFSLAVNGVFFLFG